MLLVFLLFVRMSYGQISFCDDDTVIGIRICRNEGYNKAFSETLPTSVAIRIVLYDIKEFDPDEKTVTLFVNLLSYWNDSRVMLKSSDPKQ